MNILTAMTMPVCTDASVGMVDTRLSDGRWKTSMAPEFSAFGTAKYASSSVSPTFPFDKDGIKQRVKAQKLSAFTGKECNSHGSGAGA
jgi:hypothetical protein